VLTRPISGMLRTDWTRGEVFYKLSTHIVMTRVSVTVLGVGGAGNKPCFRVDVNLVRHSSSLVARTPEFDRFAERPSLPCLPGCRASLPRVAFANPGPSP